MKEFMLLVRTEGDHLDALSPEQQQHHLKKIMEYMGGLMKSGKLKSAQPLAMEGMVISGTKGKLKDGPYNETKEVIAGYFLIEAKDLAEAVQIAKANPVFEDGTSARIEVRPIKVMDGING
ncbi:MAG: YciI family protein [Saprospiraceae bacterium]